MSLRKISTGPNDGDTENDSIDLSHRGDDDDIQKEHGHFKTTKIMKEDLMNIVKSSTECLTKSMNNITTHEKWTALNKRRIEYTTALKENEKVVRLLQTRNEMTTKIMANDKVVLARKKFTLFYQEHAILLQKMGDYRAVVLVFLAVVACFAMLHSNGDGSRRMDSVDGYSTDLSFPTDNDNVRIPGTFWGDKLHILGARLTTSYDKRDESVSFDMFGHAVGEGANQVFRLALQNHAKELSFTKASKTPLYCEVHNSINEPLSFTMENNRRVLMEFVPSVSLDGNTEHTQLIWRCDISKYLTRTEMAERQHVRVSVFTGFVNQDDAKDPIMTVDVPVDTASVGYAGPFLKSDKQPSFVQQVAQDGPVGIVLCVGEITEESLWYLPEWIQHHINVGAGQIVLGMDVMDESLLMKLQSQLSYYMERGMVVLAASSAVTDNAQLRKLRFYDQCLFHAKGVSKYVANLDLNDMWMPPLPSPSNYKAGPKAGYEKAHHHLRHQHEEQAEFWKDSAYSKSMSIMEAIQSMTGENGCNDWCFQAFPSRVIERRDPKHLDATHPQWQGFYGFPVREAGINHMYQKSVVKTEFAYQTSFHVGGSCRKSRKNVGQPFTKMFEECPLWQQRDGSLGLIHHYYKLLKPQEGVVEIKKYPDLDEYTQDMRPTTVEQLMRLQQQRQPAQKA